MAGRLPKVTEYIKNMGKSIGYAAIETIKEPTENISDFVETNEEFLKVIYSSTKNYKQTLKQLDRHIRRSKVYDAAKFGFTSLKEDLATGQFYNKKREDQAGMSGLMGDEFADFSEFENDDFGDSWGDEDSGESTSIEDSYSDRTNKIIGASSVGIAKAISTTSRMQNEVIAASAEALSNTNIASTKMLTIQTEKLNRSILTGFGGINAGMNMVNNILSGPVTTFMNESTSFYSDVSKKIDETNAYLKEMTEMQRNLYKDQSENTYKESRFDTVVGSGGLPDILAYSKQIYKNIASFDPTGGMLFGGDKDENIFKTFMGSPLKFIPQMITKLIIPTSITKAMSNFDKSISGLFSSFIARMNSYAEDEIGSGEGFNWKNILGKVLGIKIDHKKDINTSNYNKGPVPFDGQTKKAIVDVIPAHLARIEAAISGMPERMFDHETGTFRNLIDIQKEFKGYEDATARSAISSIEDHIDKWMRNWVESNSTIDTTDEQRNAAYRDLQSKKRKLGKIIIQNKGDFRLFDKDGENEFRGDFTEEEWASLSRYLQEHGRIGVSEVARNALDAIQFNNRRLEAAETQFGNALTALFDKRLLKRDDKGNIVALGARNDDILKSQSVFKNTNDYLKDILAEVRYIRMYGGKGKSNKHGYDENKAPSFNDYMNSEFADPTIEEEYREYIPIWKTKAEREEEEKAKKKNELKQLGLTRENIEKEFTSVKTLSDKWGDMKKKVDSLLKSPAKWITDIINKADKRIFEAMFGGENNEKFKDKHGRPYQSFLEYLVGRAEDIFDTFKNKVKDTWNKMWDKFKQTSVGKWVTEKGGKFVGDVKTQLASRFKFAKNRFKSGIKDTYGVLYDKYGRPILNNLMSPANVQDAYGNTLDRNLMNKTLDSNQINAIINGDYAAHDPMMTDGLTVSDQDHDMSIYEDIFNAQSDAYGRRVNKYGLTMVSPGEWIIPNPLEETRKRNLRGEKKEKSKILQAIRNNNISHNAEGNVGNRDGAKEYKKEELRTQDAIKKVMGEVSGNGAGIVADALIGSGVSLITGMIGGPLLGAAAGAGIGLVKNSEFLQEKLFGKKDKNGDREGGVIPKSVISFFKDNSKGMIDFGIAGGIAGLFTPLGLVGGALAGATLGYAKNTKWFQDMMFGNEVEGKEGLMSPETKEKLKKALPAMGIGAGAGILLGPFGLVGNAILGAAGGYVATSNKFKELILGKEDENGKRKGGIAGAFKAGLIDPLAKVAKDIGKDLKDYTIKSIVNPIKNMVEAGGALIKSSLTSIGDRISDALSGIFKKHVGQPLEEFFREKLFKPLGNMAGGLLKGVVWGAKKVIAAPFSLGNAAANMVKGRLISKGKYYNSTAEERNAQRKGHKITFALGKGMRRDQFASYDEALAGMNAEDADQVAANLRQLINSRGAKKKEHFDNVKATRDKISEYFDQNDIWNATRNDKDKKVKAYNAKRDITRLVEEGNYDGIKKVLEKRGMSEYYDTIMGMIDRDKLDSSRDAMFEEAGITKEGLKQLTKATGTGTLFGGLLRGKNRHLKDMLRLTESEAKYKHAQEKKLTEEEKQKKEELENSKTVKDRVVEIKDILIHINNSLNNAGRVLDEEGKPVDTAEAQQKQQDPDNTSAVDDNDDDIVTDGPVGDGIWAQKKHKAKEKRQALMEKMATSFSGISEGFNKLFNRDKNSEEQKESESIISKLLGFGSNAIKGVGGLIGKAGGALTNVGKIAGLVGGVALVGYGSEFVKTQLVPFWKEKIQPSLGTWFDKIANSKPVQGIKTLLEEFIGGIRDGSFFVNMAGKVAQGLSFAAENVVVPLISGVVSMAPKLISALIVGIGKGVWSWIKGDASKNENVSTDYEAYTKNAIDSYNSNLKIAQGKDRDAIAKNFNGKVSNKYASANIVVPSVLSGASKDTYINKNTGTTTGTSVTDPTTNKVRYVADNTFEAGNYEIGNGGTAVVDNLGFVTEYDSEGNIIGTYNQNSGDIITTNYTNSAKKDGFVHAAKNALIRGFGSGKAPVAARGIQNIGKRIFSNKSIAKSAKKMVTGGWNPFSLLGRLSGTVGTALKTAGRAGTEAIGFMGNLGANLNNADNIYNAVANTAKGTIANGADNIAAKPGLLKRAFNFIGNKIKNNKVTQSIMSTANTAKNAIVNSNLGRAVGTAVDFVDDKITKVKGFGAKAKDTILGLGKKASNGVKNTKIGKVVANVADNASGALNAVKNGADNILSGLAGKIKSFGKWLANSSFVDTMFKFLKKGTTQLKDSKLLKEAIEKLFVKLASEASEGLVKKAAKKAASVALKAAAGLTPITIVFWAKSFADGCVLKTESILGVSKDAGLDLGIGARCMVGLVHAINENLLLGLISTETIMKFVIDIFGGFCGITSDEYEEAQKKTAEILTAAGLDADSVSDLEEYNSQEGILKKAWNWIRGKKTVTYKNNPNNKGKGKNDSTTSSNAKGKGRGGQQGGIYAKLKYGNSTIGEAGCAPVAAASMLNGNIPEAANFAQRTGHVSSDGSTDIGFFNDYFSAKGISNKTTTNRSDVDKALKNGQSAVLLGRDPNGGYDSAYSNSSHFITAKQGPNGNLIVNDPALGRRIMKKNKVLKNMKASVITGRGARGYGRNYGYRGKGNSEEVNAQIIVDTARKEIGTKEGSNNYTKYGEEYGLNNTHWCCIFVWWVFNKAGGSDLLMKTPKCSTLLDYFKANGRIVKTSEAMPGDIVFYLFDKDKYKYVQHVGIVSEECNGSTIKSIEGNTSSTSSGSQDNGEGVYEKTRSINTVVAVARPMYSDAELVATEEDNSFISQLTKLGHSALKAMYGDQIYNLVAGYMGGETGTSTSDDPTIDSNVDESGQLAGETNDEKIWRYLRSLGYSKAATAGIMGNLYKESGLKSNNLQDSANTKFNLTDEAYTAAVNNRSYGSSKFINDSAGYGLAQWTYDSRKKGLYEATISKGRSVSNIKDHLDYINKEIDQYGLSGKLKNIDSVNDASDIILDEYEKPKYRHHADRRQASQTYYDKFKGIGRGYADKVNTKYTNESDDMFSFDDISTSNMRGTGNNVVSYNVFLETIITILMSISNNTNTLNNILEILSKNFGIDVKSSEIKAATSNKNTRQQAQDAIRTLMNNKTNSSEVSSILQSKDTSYLINIMSSIARE